MTPKFYPISQDGGVISDVVRPDAFNTFLAHCNIDKIISVDTASGYVFSLTIPAEHSPYYRFRALEQFEDQPGTGDIMQVGKKVTTILMKIMWVREDNDPVTEYRLNGKRKERATRKTFNDEWSAQENLAFNTPSLFEPITPTVLHGLVLNYTAPVGQTIINKLLQYAQANPHAQHSGHIHAFATKATQISLFGIIAQEFFESESMKFTLDLCAYQTIPPHRYHIDHIGTHNASKNVRIPMRKQGTEIDTSLVLYALLTAASFGYMHCDFHQSNIIIDNNVKPNTVFQCREDPDLGQALNDEFNAKMRKGDVSITAQREKFANKRVLTIDWGRYNILSAGHKTNVRDCIQNIKNAETDDTLKTIFFQIIQFFQVQMLQYNQTGRHADSVLQVYDHHWAYNWLMYMNNKSTFINTAGNANVPILQIAKNLRFLLLARERKEHLLQRKIIKFINDPNLAAIRAQVPVLGDLAFGTGDNQLTITTTIVRIFINQQISAHTELKRKREAASAEKAAAEAVAVVRAAAKAAAEKAAAEKAAKAAAEKAAAEKAAAKAAAEKAEKDAVKADKEAANRENELYRNQMKEEKIKEWVKEIESFDLKRFLHPDINTKEQLNTILNDSTKDNFNQIINKLKADFEAAKKKAIEWPDRKVKLMEKWVGELEEIYRFVSSKLDTRQKLNVFLRKYYPENYEFGIVSIKEDFKGAKKRKTLQGENNDLLDKKNEIIDTLMNDIGRGGSIPNEKLINDEFLRTPAVHWEQLRTYIMEHTQKYTIGLEAAAPPPPEAAAPPAEAAPPAAPAKTAAEKAAEKKAAEEAVQYPASEGWTKQGPFWMKDEQEPLAPLPRQMAVGGRLQGPTEVLQRNFEVRNDTYNLMPEKTKMKTKAPIKIETVKTEMTIPKEIEMEIDNFLEYSKKHITKIETSFNAPISPLTGMLGFYLAKCAILNNISLIDLLLGGKKMETKTPTKQIKSDLSPIMGFIQTLYLIKGPSQDKTDSKRIKGGKTKKKRSRTIRNKRVGKQSKSKKKNHA
jgi:hypothetical protein